jgi:hypothetical protein
MTIAHQPWHAIRDEDVKDCGGACGWYDLPLPEHDLPEGMDGRVIDISRAHEQILSAPAEKTN